MAVTGATLTTADADPNLAGVQIKSVGGTAAFAVQRPTGSVNAIFTITEVTPQATPTALGYSQQTGTFTQPYSAAAVSPVTAFHFAFDATGGPAVPGYTLVPGSAYGASGRLRLDGADPHLQPRPCRPGLQPAAARHQLPRRRHLPGRLPVGASPTAYQVSVTHGRRRLRAGPGRTVLASVNGGAFVDQSWAASS